MILSGLNLCSSLLATWRKASYYANCHMCTTLGLQVWSFSCRYIQWCAKKMTKCFTEVCVYVTFPILDQIASCKIKTKTWLLCYYFTRFITSIALQFLFLFRSEMAPSKQEDQRQMILQFWKQETRNASEIHSLTKIQLKTIYCNLKKLDKTGDIKH